MQLSPLLTQRPVQSVEDAIALMTAIDERLDDADGLKWFNRLYLRVTVSVKDALAAAVFNDAAFMARLDVVFAQLYFDALVQAERDSTTAPAAWRPLLEARTAAGITRLRFAIAGMNAHINRDLPDGIVRCFQALGGDPLTAGGRKQDFDSVNAILERVEEEVKREFAIGIIGVVDELGHEMDDEVAMWKVRKARAAAWTNARVLWTLRDIPALRDDFFRRLDGLVGLASRGLLLPRFPQARG
jgi:hypothetical protein